MRKIIILAIAVIGVAVLLFWKNQHDLPQGVSGEETDQIARSIEKSVGIKQWNETEAVSWEFNGKRELLWDKHRGFCRVKWAKYKAFINLNNQQGVAWNDENMLQGKELQEALNMAWKYWINDSFWLNPLAKLFDEGTARSWVTLEDGVKGLEISYTKGGVTPGDAYVWVLDTNHRPIACRMWVSNMPIKGIEFSWNGWTQLKGGAWVATTHQSATFDINIAKVSAGTVQELAGEDIFAQLAQ